MRKLKCALTLLLSAGILAASSDTGKWKMNAEKSKYTTGDAPKDGGNGYCLGVNDRTRDTSFTKDGTRLVAQHLVVSTDGKTMTVTVKGIGPDGKPVEGVLVFDKE